MTTTAPARRTSAPARGRRTQQERSAATRAALLDATIECIAEHGYAGTTTARVAQRAGLSRGAQMHHFQRKAPLVVAALAHLAQRRRDELLARAERERPADAAAALDLMWASFSGPLFTAALELWLAARTDPELRHALLPVEREIGRGIRASVARVFDVAGIAGDAGRRTVELAGNAMRGMALQQLLDPSPARVERQLSFIKETVSSYLERQHP